MNTSKKTIEDLYTDNTLANESEIVEAIYPFVTIQRDNNKIIIKNFDATHRQKIIAYCLAKKLLASKAEDFLEKVTAKEILEEIGLVRGTVDGEFGKLRKKGIFRGKKEYTIPSYKIVEALKLLVINKK